MENKCEKLGLQHAWEISGNSMVYLTDPVQYPDPQRKCVNCGKVERLVIVQREIKEWKS